MAETAVSFLLENVSQLLKYYVDLASKAKDELEQLEKDLKFMKAFLQKAAKTWEKDEPFRELERQIRTVVYEAEDTIDLCLVEAVAASKGKNWWRYLKPSRVSLAEQVRKLSAMKVQPMFATMKITGGSIGNVEGPGALPPKVQTPRRDNIVGLEDEEKKIIGLLKDQTTKLDVVSIFGMPGLGKTTLAWKIYQNKDFKHEFTKCIWVYVSKAFSRKDVLLQILNAFESHDRSNLREDVLIDKVREYLEDIKFFLVLDDIWTDKDWKSIEVVLPKDNFTSKVLITSRFTTVCQLVNPGRVPSTLRFLNDDESWQLLQLEVFGNVGNCPSDLQPIGIQIAKECKGLPLAIVVIGGFLLGQRSATKTTNVIKNEWNKVRENLGDYLLRDDEQGNEISIIVSWSYGILPNELRECFLYFGVFPDNYEIQTWTLIHLWIAEGFIQHKPGQSSSLEETAMENLKNLVARNLVMVEKTNPNGEAKTVRVHDLIRAFCIRTSTNDQNLFQEIKTTNEGVFDPAISEIHNHRRLCIHSNLQEFLSEQLEGPHVRSFLCFDKGSSELDTTCTNTIPDAFELLRVLDSKSIKFKKFPKLITKLIHLRYITVSMDDLDLLPEGFSRFWNLQTLVVETKKGSLKIEANIWAMIQLRHLKTKAAIILANKKEVKDQSKAGENLQTLSRLSPQSCSKDVFKRASKLKKLGIRGNLATFFKDHQCIEDLRFLEKLKLVNDKSKDVLHCLPQPLRFPSNLKRLTISSTSLGWEHMSTLATIKNLEVLKLKDNAFIGFEWSLNMSDCFGKLHFLLIADTNLGNWVASSPNFPELRSLLLFNCGQLQDIPFGLAEKLEKLDIDNLGELAVKSALKIEESKKLEQGGARAGWGGQFKLSIGPGCKKPTPGQALNRSYGIGAATPF